LENRNDIVPHPDASDNPNTASHTTVTFDHQTETVQGNHQIANNYTDVAKQLDGRSDPSVEAFKKVWATLLTAAMPRPTGTKLIDNDPSQYAIFRHSRRTVGINSSGLQRRGR
jgi:hypothetical protein